MNQEDLNRTLVGPAIEFGFVQALLMALCRQANDPVALMDGYEIMCDGLVATLAKEHPAQSALIQEKRAHYSRIAAISSSHPQ